MNTRTITLCGALMVIHLQLLQPCNGASFFVMSLERDSMYTPCKMSLTLKLTVKAKIQSKYRFQVSVYVSNTLMRKQIFPVTKGEPVVFDLGFPKVYSKTDVRCRTELFIDAQFIEAEEMPLVLWPSLVPYPKRLKDKAIWVFDISGRLQKIFDNLEVETIDATFQAARTFGTPNIVFIGQNLDPNNMQVITDSLASINNKPVTVFLKQNQLPRDINMRIPKEDNRSIRVVCDFNSPLLKGLDMLDIMHMVDNAIHIELKKQRDKEWIIDSSVTETNKDNKCFYSYLVSVRSKEQVTIYCQLPVTDSDDPRYGILLRNLLESANEISDSLEN